MINDRTGTVTFLDKVIVGTVFILSCIIGISMAVKPNWIHRLGKNQNSTNNKSLTNQIKHQGHHPVCKEFKEHIIKIGNNVYCAGCTGLAAGSVIAIILMCIYIIISFESNDELTQLFLSFGFTILSLILLQNMPGPKSASTRVITNIGLPIGFYFIVIGTLEYTGESIPGLIAVVISVLFVDTRIQVSNWRHKKICRICDRTCKVYQD
jgi:hypothetical protein